MERIPSQCSEKDELTGPVQTDDQHGQHSQRQAIYNPSVVKQRSHFNVDGWQAHKSHATKGFLQIPRKPLQVQCRCPLLL